MTADLQRTTSALVFNNSYSGKSADLVSLLQTPLSQIQPEVRVFTQDGLYVGGVNNLEVKSTSLEGHLYLTSYKEIVDTKLSDSMQKSILEKLFVKPAKFDLEYDNKQYAKEWKIVVNGSIVYDKKLWPWLIDRLKSEAINNHQVALNRDLTYDLFNPIFDSLFMCYEQLMNR